MSETQSKKEVQLMKAHGDDSESASGSDGTTSGTSSKTKHNRELPAAIATEENKNVARLRLIVIAVLIACTAGVAFGVHRYVSKAEEASFEENFEDDSDKVLEAIGSTLDQTLGSVDNYLAGLVSFARYTNSTWPFVTLPDYAVRLAKLRSLSKAVLVTQYHYVTGKERSDWESYSVANDAWVQQGIDNQRTDPTYQGKIVESFWTRGDIHDSADPYDAPGPYLPKWQQAPVVPIYASYNWDAMTFPSLAKSLDVVKDDRRIAISDVSNIPYPDDPESKRQAEGNNHFIKDYVGDGEDETEPFSDLYFPILDYAADFVTIPEHSKAQGNFVGVFAMTFYWRDLIKDILPTGSNGIVVVFENKCGQTFTYQVNGPETVYLGRGDLHQSQYDAHEKHSLLVELDAFSIRDRSYTGLPLSDQGCAYTLRVYPSSEMHDIYTTTDPILFTLVAVSIFVFTSLVFIGYDYMVERRQQKVMSTAVRSTAIVSSLFPSNVRDRLFPEEDPSASKGRFESNKARIKTFLSDGKSTEMQPAKSFQDTSPIADLFEHCTVLFADIAGFTAWSSVREPAQVFRLLETLYGAFDSIARRRGVFKVETIGDEYVAATGLPERRDDHYLVMIKFARDCMFKMNDIVRNLEQSLGSGTSNLSMRFGIHSGPVTAGVLRGEKSRFQLFGDTVNTASRMESTGIPNKIQVSSTTANLLISSGKVSWVKKRQSTIEAKGKGRLQTYWIDTTQMMNMTNTTPTAVTATTATTTNAISSVDGSYSSADTSAASDTTGNNDNKSMSSRLAAWHVDE